MIYYCQRVSWNLRPPNKECCPHHGIVVPPKMYSAVAIVGATIFWWVSFERYKDVGRGRSNLFCPKFGLPQMFIFWNKLALILCSFLRSSWSYQKFNVLSMIAFFFNDDKKHNFQDHRRKNIIITNLGDMFFY